MWGTFWRTLGRRISLIFMVADLLLPAYSLGFLPCAGLRLGVLRQFQAFLPPALAQQALPAIIFQALRRLRGVVLFRSLRPSSSWGFPFWLLGLTVQSSRPAFGRRLTFVRYA